MLSLVLDSNAYSTGKSPYEDTDIDTVSMRQIVRIPLPQVDRESRHSDCLEVGT